MDLALRSIVAFLFILALTRIVGRRELSSMEPFDVILLVVIGDLVQQGVTQNDQSVTGIVIVLSVMTLMTAGVAFVNFRFRRLRPLIEGRPVVLIEDGRLIDENVKRERLTIGEVHAEARLQQIDSLESVRLAVLETSGRISFIPADEPNG
jgi:uncharacterized membrane protein YcaP (DUF421 family)